MIDICIEQQMNCEICHKNPATKKIHIAMQGQMKEFNVCENCADMHGLSNPFAGLPDVLGIILLGLLAQTLTQRETETSDLKCQSCGLTISQFRANGTFGCPACYDSFRDFAESMLRRIHGSTKHIGKKPVNLRAKPDSHTSLSELEKQLQQAIQAENYERAAQLRDLIHDFKGQ